MPAACHPVTPILSGLRQHKVIGSWDMCLAGLCGFLQHRHCPHSWSWTVWNLASAQAERTVALCPQMHPGLSQKRHGPLHSAPWQEQPLACPARDQRARASGPATCPRRGPEVCSPRRGRHHWSMLAHLACPWYTGSRPGTGCDLGNLFQSWLFLLF